MSSPIYLLAVLAMGCVDREDSELRLASQRVPVTCQRDLQVVALPGDPEPFTLYVCSGEDGEKVLLASKHAYVDTLQTTLDQDAVLQLGARHKKQLYPSATAVTISQPVKSYYLTPYQQPYIRTIISPSSILNTAAALAVTKQFKLIPAFTVPDVLTYFYRLH